MDYDDLQTAYETTYRVWVQSLDLFGGLHPITQGLARAATFLYTVIEKLKALRTPDDRKDAEQ